MTSGYAGGEKVETLGPAANVFMTDHIYPKEKVWHAHTVSEQTLATGANIEELKLQGTTAACWNLWGPKSRTGRHACPTPNTRPLVRDHLMGMGGGGVLALRKCFMLRRPTLAILKRCCWLR